MPETPHVERAGAAHPRPPRERGRAYAVARVLANLWPLSLLRDRLWANEQAASDLRARIGTLASQVELLRGEVAALQARHGGAADPDRVRCVTGRDMTNHFAQVEETYADLAQSFDDYRRLIDALIAVAGLDLQPLYQFAGAGPDARGDPPNGARHALGLRHDIDADPVTALRMARFLASRGVCGSFYLLHTAPYYGSFEGNLFVRNPELAAWVRGFIVAGCELGLHNDAMGAAQHPAVDGAAHLEGELAWLRSHGAVIRGTVGHNSLPVYGAENSEVFLGRRLWPREPTAGGGKPLPLERLDETALGLAYEGTFAAPRANLDVAQAERVAAAPELSDVRSESWMRTYLLENPFHDWTVDVQVWIVGRNRWVLGGRVRERELFEWDLSGSAVVERIAGLPAGTRTLMVVHPEYFCIDGRS